MKTILQAILITLVMTVLTGFVYPLAITGASQLLFHAQANGSLVTDAKGQVTGSTLLAQPFSDPKYFWPRPSAASYATVASGASNLGPTSAALVKAIAANRQQFGNDAPVEMLTASASGLDPHISPLAARLQVPRVALARHLEETKVNALVDQAIEGRQLGFLGEERVNVLALNLALDGLK
ncbi:MAG: potassium-transporting ATPase subunit KdpC [Chthoniobacteraceae bacterium]